MQNVKMWKWVGGGEMFWVLDYSNAEAGCMADALDFGVYWAVKGAWLIRQRKKQSKVFSFLIFHC